MKKRLSHLTAPHLRLLFRAIVFVLRAWQRIEDTHWLRPWLLPDRRQARYHVVGCERHRQISPALAAGWVFGLALIGFLVASHDPRPWLLLAAAYGFAVSAFVILKTTRLLKWNLGE